MSEWKEYKLGEICSKIGSGATPKGGKEAYLGGDTSLIRSQNVLDFSFSWDGLAYINDEQAAKLNGVEIEKGDVLLNITGDSVARACIVPQSALPARVNQHVAIIRGDATLVLNEYILYFLQYKKPYLLSLSKAGATRNALTKGMIEDFPIPLPPLVKQAQIVDVLSSLDDKIAVNKKICENLEAQAQALFKHWFVDFAPFKDGKFVESELGLIPEGWRVGTLGDFVDNLGGYSYTSSELQPSMTAMATIKNFVRGGGFKIEGYKEIVISKNIKEYQFVNLFDVLVAHTDLTQNAEVVGNPAIVLSTAGYEKLIMSMDLTKIVPKDKRLTATLIHSILSTSKFKEHALGYVNGTTVLHMSKKAVPEYKLAMPNNLDIIKELTAILDDLYSAMSETYAENLRLSTLRDTLLPKLMSGQIQINEI